LTARAGLVRGLYLHQLARDPRLNDNRECAGNAPALAGADG
jgi:hypothetical protein